MARFSVEGYIVDSQDPNKHVIEYTNDLSDNTTFTENKRLPEETFLCYDNSGYAPSTDKGIFYIPPQDYRAFETDYVYDQWGNQQVQKPLLYRVEGYYRDLYNNNLNWTQVAFRPYEDMDFEPLPLVQRIHKVYNSTISPTQTSNSSSGDGDTIWAWGLDSAQNKGLSYIGFKPVVNYNPNKVVVVPYLARYKKDTNNNRDIMSTMGSPTYQNEDILMLDDILNDTIISGIGNDNQYALKYAFVIDGKIEYTSSVSTSGSGSNRQFKGYLLSQSPLEFSSPYLRAYTEVVEELANNTVWYPSVCRALYLPLWNSNNVLIGVEPCGVPTNYNPCVIVDIKYTSYCEMGEYVFGDNYGIWNPATEELDQRTVSEQGIRPYVTVADLSGANRELYDNLVRTTASLGMAFCTSWGALTDVRSTHGITDAVIDAHPDSIYYPVISDKAQVIGVTKGQANKTNPLKVAGDDGTNPYDTVPVIDPDDENDHNDYIDETPLREFLPVNPSNTFNTRYALDEGDIHNFEDFLWTGDQSIVANVLDGLQMFGENPMNFFLSLKMFPFDVTRFADSTTQGALRFGNGVVVKNHNDETIYVTKLTDVNIVIDLGTINFRKFFKNFLDYEPYTTAKLYVPFCGEISVETSVFVGHEINVKLIVDIVTGSCCAVVFKDKLACLSLNGNIAVDIPITGENYQEYINATKEFISTAGKAIDSALSMGTGVSNSAGSGTSTSRSLSNGSFSHSDSSSQSNNKMTNSHKSYSANGALSGLGSAIMGAYDWYHTPTALQISGSASDMCNLYKPMYAYFVIEQPVPMITPGYAENYGFAAFDYGSLPPEGLVVCRNAHVQPETATEPETTELNELLNTGVWI
ncbi:hypothetical protein [Pseudobutyrivibrio sp.]|jgi:hypothetical protein|uniref:hypothetical protein n=1 Tax=Pseudobutyrivibrio sp. TaxID=2014367 RepID=UPI0025E9B0C0|nr:hypothetical protein [Pseudobutyrivibrio sp.]